MPRSKRTSTVISAAVATAVGLLMLVPLMPAQGAAGRLEIGQQAWYWSSNQQFTLLLKDRQFFENMGHEAPEQAPGLSQDFILSDGGPRGLAPVPPGTLSPVSYGHLGVSLINGSSDMRSYVKFNMSSLPLGAKIDSFKMRLSISKMSLPHLQYHLDAEARAPATFNESSARIDACPLTEPWGIAEGSAPYAFEFQRPEVERQSTDINRKDQRNEPLYDCGKARIRGELTPGGDALVWDLTELAQEWADDALSLEEPTNEGVALVGVAQGLSPTWLVELHGAEYSLNPSEFGVPVPLPVAPPELSDGERNHYVSKADSGFANVAFSPGKVDESSGPPAPTPVGTTTTIVQPGTSQTIIQPGQPGSSEVVYVPIAGGPGAVPVGDIVTPGWVFLAFPLGLLGLGALLGAVGKDDLALASVPIAGSRVASMLRQRRLGR